MTVTHNVMKISSDCCDHGCHLGTQGPYKRVTSTVVEAHSTAQLACSRYCVRLNRLIEFLSPSR
jgi:hypothetical protein